jgi:glutamine amidotransferase
MQVLFAASAEAPGGSGGVVPPGKDWWTEGCAAWPGTIERLDAGVLPHMGWNTVAAPTGSVLFNGIEPGTRFYFVHSYALREAGAGELAAKGARISWTEHGDRFAAAVEHDVLFATQFHPEKSGDAGATLLANWLGAL